jgi:hypothetical protein
MKPVLKYCSYVVLSGLMLSPLSAEGQTWRKHKKAKPATETTTTKPAATTVVAPAKPEQVSAAPAKKDVDAPKKEVYKEPVRLTFPDDKLYPNSQNPGAATPTPAPAKPVVVKQDSVKPKLGMPVLTFDTKEVDFGNIKTGDKPAHTYTITNTGDKDMDIELVSGCDCTDIDWTRTTIKPGEKGIVKIIYNSNRAEPHEHKILLKKTITVILKQTNPNNDYQIIDELHFKMRITD